MQRNFNGAVVAVTLAALAAAPALARGNDLIINDGFGEQVTVRHGFFGRNTEVVKDRLGDGYATKTGLFGQKQQDVNILGNSLQRKKGILGGSDVRGSTIFGDRVETKKGIFGRRTTYIDASGSANVVRTLWDQNKSKLFGTANTGATPLGELGKLGAGSGMMPAPTPNGALETAPGVTSPAPGSF